jgi:hypothetical protein
MARGEQVVALGRDHSRGHHENGARASGGPRRADTRKPVGGWIGPPVGREILQVDLAGRHPVGNLGRDRDEIIWNIDRIYMNEILEDRERETLGGVDDRGALLIPATAGEPGAPAIEGRVLPPADSPDANQL